jgi:hypothetical protein
MLTFTFTSALDPCQDYTLLEGTVRLGSLWELTTIALQPTYTHAFHNHGSQPRNQVAATQSVPRARARGAEPPELNPLPPDYPVVPPATRVNSGFAAFQLAQVTIQ